MPYVLDVIATFFFNILISMIFHLLMQLVSLFVFKHISLTYKGKVNKSEECKSVSRSESITR